MNMTNIELMIMMCKIFAEHNKTSHIKLVSLLVLNIKHLT